MYFSSAGESECDPVQLASTFAFLNIREGGLLLGNASEFCFCSRTVGKGLLLGTGCTF